ncbi:c-type cytochrome [Gaetbulibacter sp. M240]|uniref:c-type cytochrome n=1 Tax=Gaetbulibacter sp. M240 TaxID=3126511 RepID=UPI00374FC512
MVDIFLRDYDVYKLDDSEDHREVKLGYEIFMNTAQYIGPENGDPIKAYSGNNLACTNCHLAAGTKPYSGPLIGVIKRFPQYRGREDKIGTIEERINGCMERSMNGRMMPETAPEMTALISYLKWLGRYAPDDGKIEGQGFLEITIPERAVDLEKGAQIFTLNCVVCHTAEGKGMKKPVGPGYLYPPLWGDDSYNNGAGMTRVITAAQFIKGNMPFGVQYTNPTLSDEEAYDVAGYINQQSRPVKPHLEKDFPDLKKKPVSTPYPPYVDDFPIEQHQLGPFQPIMAFYKTKFNMEKTK